MVINSSNKVDANCLSPVQCVLKSGDGDQRRTAVRAGGSSHLQNSEVAFTPMLLDTVFSVPSACASPLTAQKCMSAHPSKPCTAYAISLPTRAGPLCLSFQGRFYTVEILATEFKQRIERSTFSKVSEGQPRISDTRMKC